MASVLIVDDSSVVRKGLKEMLESLGHRVVGEASNGSQAFSEYALHKPDVVTMDLTMEGMSGAEATSKIVLTFPQARIIVVSAIEERKVILDALERGARHFIVKPITKEKISAVIANVMQQNFDRQQHLEMVRRLKGDECGPLGNTEYIPPYKISTQDGKLVMIRLNPILSLTSCQSLLLELEEYLQNQPRVLLDFGSAGSFEPSVLLELNKMIEYIESKSGVVKAASRNQRFVSDVSIMDPNPGFLNSVLKYVSN